MFSSLRNHFALLPYSQRLYFSNYEYYNDYEELEQFYKDDLSKMIFNCKRKTQALIALFDTSSQHYQSTDDRLVEVSERRQPHIKTMEDINDKFVQIYSTNNYSDVKNDRIDAKENFNVSIFKLFQAQLEKMPSFKPAKAKLHELMQVFLTEMAQSFDDASIKIQTFFQSQSQAGDSRMLQLQIWHAFQMEAKHMIKSKMNIFDQEKRVIEMLQFQEFYVYFSYVMEGILLAEYWNVLLMAQPFTLHLNKVFHPLTIALYHYMRHSEAFLGPAPPRIAVLNLDGKESPFNIRAAKKIGSQLLYISVYREPTANEQYWSCFQKESQNFTIPPTFNNVNAQFSRLIQQEVQAQPNQNQSKVFLYPLNSIYLRRKHYNNEQKTSNNDKCGAFPSLSSSTDIFFLCQVEIFEHLRQFRPDIILVSYNGSLDLNEMHFAEIMKHLTIIADHKVVLFTNMTGMFKEGETEGMEEDMEDHQKMEDACEGEEDLPQDKIQIIQQFYKKYLPYKYEEINEERFFTNLSLFLKISSGTFSLKSHYFPTSSNKYSMATRYMYLERLAALRNNNKTSALGKWKSSEIQQIYSKYSQLELKENRKENEAYSKKIDEIISDLLKSVFDEESMQSGTSKHIYYRLLQIREEQIRQYMLINNVQDNQRQFIAQDQRLCDKLLYQYFMEKKNALLIQNLESYRTKKAFYYDENDQRTIKMKCFKFYTGTDQNEELTFQKYTQIIIDYKTSKIIIVNHKMSEERHAILQGDISYTQKNYLLKMSQVDEPLQGQMLHLDLQDRSDIIYVNYNYCFLKNKVVLYWPQKFSIKEQIRHKLVGIDYKPQTVHKMLSIYLDKEKKDEKKYKYECIEYKGDPKIIPRYGCSSWQANDSSFYAFGGIYDNTLDFYDIGSGISIFQINDRDKSFKVENQSKKKDKLYKNTDKNNKFTFNTILKPKIHYRVERSSKLDDNSLIISGGYGRSFTNFYNIFSHQSYTFQLESRRLTKNDPDKRGRRVIKLDKPLQINDPGKYFTIANNQNVSEVQERFTDSPKDFFIFQSKTQKNNTIQKDVISFIDQDYKVSDFRVGHKKLYLFGYDRTIRQKIYTKYWSPELFVVDGLKLHIIYITLKTIKTPLYNISNFLTPREQDLTSVCLEEDRLLILSNSSVITSLDSNTERYVLYQGNLSNMAEVILRKEVAMNEIFEFKNTKEGFLKGKTVIVIDQKIMIVGGVNMKTEGEKYVREDYLLEKRKNRYHSKIRNLESTFRLDLPSPVLIKQNQHYYMYSFFFEEKVVGEEFVDLWKIKIETLKPNQTNGEEQCFVGAVEVYTYDFQNKTAIMRKPVFEDPKFVKIVPYKRFDLNKFRQFIQKILIRLNKLTQSKQITDALAFIKWIDQQKDQNNLMLFLLQKGPAFKLLLQILNDIHSKPDQERQNNYETQELIQDVKKCYSMINKLIIQDIICRGKEDQMYKFIVEDRKSKKVKYIAIGPLKTTKLAFFRIRFKHDFSICLNKNVDQELFFHPSILSCDQIELNDKVKLPRLQESMNMEEEIQAKISVTYKV